MKTTTDDLIEELFGDSLPPAKPAANRNSFAATVPASNTTVKFANPSRSKNASNDEASRQRGPLLAQTFGNLKKTARHAHHNTIDGPKASSSSPSSRLGVHDAPLPPTTKPPSFLFARSPQQNGRPAREKLTPGRGDGVDKERPQMTSPATTHIPANTEKDEETANDTLTLAVNPSAFETSLPPVETPPPSSVSSAQPQQFAAAVGPRVTFTNPSHYDHLFLPNHEDEGEEDGAALSTSNQRGDSGAGGGATGEDHGRRAACGTSSKFTRSAVGGGSRRGAEEVDEDEADDHSASSDNSGREEGDAVAEDEEIDLGGDTILAKSRRDERRAARKAQVMHSILFALTNNFPNSSIFDDYNRDGSRKKGKRQKKKSPRQTAQDNDSAFQNSSQQHNAKAFLPSSRPSKFFETPSAVKSFLDVIQEAKAMRELLKDRDMLPSRYHGLVDLETFVEKYAKYREAYFPLATSSQLIGGDGDDANGARVHDEADLFAAFFKSLGMKGDAPPSNKEARAKHGDDKLAEEELVGGIRNTRPPTVGALVRTNRTDFDNASEPNTTDKKAPTLTTDDVPLPPALTNEKRRRLIQRRVSMERRALNPDVYEGAMEERESLVDPTSNAEERGAKVAERFGGAATLNVGGIKGMRDRQKESSGVNAFAAVDDEESSTRLESKQVDPLFEAKLMLDRKANPRDYQNTAVEESLGMYKRLDDDEAFEEWLGIGNSNKNGAPNAHSGDVRNGGGGRAKTLAERIHEMERETRRMSRHLRDGDGEDDSSAADHSDNGDEAFTHSQPSSPIDASTLFSDLISAIADQFEVPEGGQAVGGSLVPFSFLSSLSNAAVGAQRSRNLQIKRIAKGAPNCSPEDIESYLNGVFCFKIPQNPSSTAEERRRSRIELSQLPTKTSSSLGLSDDHLLVDDDSSSTDDGAESSSSNSASESDPNMDVNADTTETVRHGDFDKLLRQFRCWEVLIDPTTQPTLKRRQGKSNRSPPSPPQLPAAKKLSVTCEIVSEVLDEAVQKLNVFTRPLSFSLFEEDCAACLKALSDAAVSASSSSSSSQKRWRGKGAGETDSLTAEGIFVDQVFDKRTGQGQPQVKMRSNDAVGTESRVKPTTAASRGGLPSSAPTSLRFSLLAKLQKAARVEETASLRIAKSTPTVCYVKGPVRMRVPYDSSGGGAGGKSRALDKAHAAVLKISAKLDEEFGDDTDNDDDEDDDEDNAQHNRDDENPLPISGFPSMLKGGKKGGKAIPSGFVAFEGSVCSGEGSASAGAEHLDHPTATAKDDAIAVEESPANTANNNTSPLYFINPSDLKNQKRQQKAAARNGDAGQITAPSSNSILKKSFAVVGKGRKSVITLLPETEKELRDVLIDDATNAENGSESVGSESFSKKVARRLSRSVALSSSAGDHTEGMVDEAHNSSASFSSRKDFKKRMSVAFASFQHDESEPPSSHSRKISKAEKRNSRKTADENEPAFDDLPIRQVKGTFYRALSYLRNPDWLVEDSPGGCVGGGGRSEAISPKAQGSTAANTTAAAAANDQRAQVQAHMKAISDYFGGDFVSEFGDANDNHEGGHKTAPTNSSPPSVSRRINDSSARITFLEEEAARRGGRVKTTAADSSCGRGEAMAVEELIAAYMDTLIAHDAEKAELAVNAMTALDREKRQQQQQQLDAVTKLQSTDIENEPSTTAPTEQQHVNSVPLSPAIGGGRGDSESKTSAVPFLLSDAQHWIIRDALLKKLVNSFTYMAAVDIGDMVNQLLLARQEDLEREDAKTSVVTNVSSDLATVFSRPSITNSPPPPTAQLISNEGSGAIAEEQSSSLFNGADRHDGSLTGAAEDSAMGTDPSRVPANLAWLREQGSEHFIFPRPTTREDEEAFDVRQRARDSTIVENDPHPFIVGSGVPKLSFSAASAFTPPFDAPSFAASQVTSAAAAAGANRPPAAFKVVTGPMLRLAFDLDNKEAVAGGGWLTTVEKVMDHVRYQQLPPAHSVLEPCSTISSLASKLSVFLNCQCAVDEEDVKAREAVLARIVFLQDRFARFSKTVLDLETKISEFDRMHAIEKRVKQLLFVGQIEPLERLIAVLLEHVPFPQQRAALAHCAGVIGEKTAICVDLLQELSATAPPSSASSFWLQTEVLDLGYRRLESIADGWRRLSFGFIDPCLYRVLIDTDLFVLSKPDHLCHHVDIDTETDSEEEEGGGESLGDCADANDVINQAFLLLRPPGPLSPAKQRRVAFRKARTRLEAIVNNPRHPARFEFERHLFELSERGLEAVEKLLLAPGPHEEACETFDNPFSSSPSNHGGKGPKKKKKAAPPPLSVLKERISGLGGLTTVTVAEFIRRAVCEYGAVIENTPLEPSLSKAEAEQQTSNGVSVAGRPTATSSKVAGQWRPLSATAIALKVKGVASESIGEQLIMSARYALGEAGAAYDDQWGFAMSSRA